jgi:hypothetical protein
MFNVRKELSSSYSVAPEFVHHDHPRLVLKSDGQPSEETLRRRSVTVPLNQDVEHDTVLIHGAPGIMKDTVDPDEHFIEKVPSGLAPRGQCS